jgi:hypothetical protein
MQNRDIRSFFAPAGARKDKGPGYHSFSARLKSARSQRTIIDSDGEEDRNPPLKLENKANEKYTILL